LAICKRIIDLMDGKIWVEDAEGQGTVFKFEVGLKAGSALIEEATTEAPLQQLTFTGKRILAAEDIDINREVLSAILEETAVDLDFATNGQEALDIVRRSGQDYDLILMDMQMPEMDGLEATRQIRAWENDHNGDVRKAHIPIVAMTANAFKEDIERCLEAGMDSYLSKPIDLESLYTILNTYLK
jgi:CheY-like chemotaxis protein